jgi:hypothetical protein
MSRKNPHTRLKLLIVLLIVTALGLSGCGAGEESPTEQGQTGSQNPGTPGGSTNPNPGSDSDPSPGSGSDPNPDEPPNDPAIACDSLQTQFNTEIWPILQNQCFGCHEQNKVTSDLVLLGDSFNNYLQTNFNTFRQVAAKKDNSGTSLMLTKPSNSNSDHSGGQRFAINSSEYQTFSNMVSELETCTDNSNTSAALILDSGYKRLRKTTFALGGRLPTNTEEQQIAASSNDPAQAAIEFASIIDNLMTEDFFFDRLKTIFNDLLLLDAFPGTRSLGSFDLRNFANENYFDTANLDPLYDSSTRNTIRNEAGYGLAQAPLELIAHVVRQKRPFTEILTADYVLVNPYSATIFGADVGDVSFNFEYGDDPALFDHREFREASIVATTGDISGSMIPQAGIISTLTFLRRYPSTNTNRNRARSRYVYQYFLDLNVEGLASRDTLDLDNVVGTFPTLEDPQCKACHDTVDPVAGLFKNRRNNGSYRGDYTNWYSERNTPQMLKPGFSINTEDQLPTANSANALQWLADRIVNDSGFALSVVKTLFKGLTGQEIPQDAAFFESLRTTFVDSNYDLKSVVKVIVISDYFLANSISQEASASDFRDYGMARLLTPEQLHQKLLAVTNGYNWQAPKSRRGLLDKDTFLTLYGGIDSDEITTRTTQPTSLMVGVQERVANQTACVVVPSDFNQPAERIFFPDVEITDTPDTAAGIDRIKQNLAHLHKHILGEQLSVADSELIRTYDLFVAVRDMTTGNNIPVDCDTGLISSNPVRIDADRTVRPWMAVVAYLLSDYKFLYE